MKKGLRAIKAVNVPLNEKLSVFDPLASPPPPKKALPSPQSPPKPHSAKTKETFPDPRAFDQSPAPQPPSKPSLGFKSSLRHTCYCATIQRRCKTIPFVYHHNLSQSFATYQIFFLNNLHVARLCDHMVDNINTTLNANCSW